MSKEDTMYFYAKCVETMVYTKDIDEFLEYLESYFVMDEKIILSTLSTFIEMNQNYIDEQMKNNVYKIIQYYKEKCIKKEIQIQDQANLLIRQINTTNDSKIKTLIKNEISIRYEDIIITYTALKNTKSAMKFIKEKVEMDFEILINHSSFYNDEDFKEIKRICAENITDYIGCINMITTEHPNLLDSKLFVNRVKEVIEPLNTKEIKKFRKNMGI